MSDVGSTSGSSLPHSTSTGTRTESSASFVGRWVMNMALMDRRERRGRARQPFRVLAGRLEVIEPQVDLRA